MKNVRKPCHTLIIISTCPTCYPFEKAKSIKMWTVLCIFRRHRILNLLASPVTGGLLTNTYQQPSSSILFQLYVKVDFMGERVTVELARGTPHGRDKER